MRLRSSRPWRRRNGSTSLAVRPQSQALTRTRTAPATAPKRRHSLRWRLPAAFGVLVLLLSAAFLWAAYREVARSLLHEGTERASAGAAQVSDMLEQSKQALERENQERRTDPALQAFLRNPGDETRAAALEVITPNQGFRRSELWFPDGELALEVATPAEDPGSGPELVPRGAPPTAEAFTPLRAVGDRNVFDVVIAIRDGPAADSALLGHYRRFGSISSNQGEAVRRLVGDQAIVKVGSPGGVWTDLSSITEAPPAAGSEGRLGAGVAADGSRWVGATVVAAGTPWQVWVGFPRAAILAPVDDFMRRMALLALLFVLVTIASMAYLGVRLTRPLHALMGAVDEIASGDYSQRVAFDRRDEIGRLSSAFNVMTDRIEDAYAALRESHAQTHFALAAARIGVWETQIASGRMICSESMALVHRLPVARLPQTRDSFLELVEAEDRDAVGEVLEGVQKDHADFDIQYRAQGPDGQLHWIEGKGRVRVEDGRPVSVLGVSIDVTDRHRLESQFLQAQKMEAVGQLAGGVAHDFNNLLTVIIANASALLEELDEGSALREDVDEILEASASATSLTHQLLTFSRRQVTRPQVIDVNEVVAQMESLLRRVIGEQVELATTLGPDVGSVEIDPGHLQQVLVNLAINSRDAMPHGGDLTIASARRDLSEPARDALPLSPGHYVVLSVRDTGAGMDEETVSHIFEPFFTTKPVGQGTGLGLATAHGIVEQSGGHIRVASALGHGTTFEIYLPATSEPTTAATTAPAPADEPSRGTETILVVEDNDPVRAVATTILERAGYKVLTAAGGEDALALLDGADATPDLVLSDVVMPGMTGPQLFDQLRQRYPDLRVLFTSGYSGDALARHGTMDAQLLEKPYTPASLRAKVREVLGE